MTLKRFFHCLSITALFFLIIPLPATACGPYYYAPREYLKYRAVEESTVTDAYLGNCRLWQAETSNSTSLEDIQEVVYDYSVEWLLHLKSGRSIKGNSFVDYISTHKRSDILDYLILAKSYEQISREYKSEWYYPEMETSYSATDMLKQALAYGGLKEGKPLASRYALLTIRLLRLTGQDSLTLAYYDSIAPMMKQNVVRDMMGPYLFGACVKTGNLELGKRYIPKDHSWRHMSYYYKDKNQLQLMEMLYDADPKNVTLFNDFAECMDVIESQRNQSGKLNRNVSLIYYGKEYSADSIYQLAARIAKEERTANIAEWYYTAAYLADAVGRTKEAHHLLNKASKNCNSEFLKGSIRVLRMYVDAKSSHCDAAYMNRLREDIVWLSDKCKSHLTPQIVYETLQGWNLNSNRSYYYWNDMLRCIVIGVVCPQLIKQDKTEQALLLLNYADNMLRKHCIKQYKNYLLPEKEEVHSSYNYYSDYNDIKVSDSILISHKTELYTMLDSMPSKVLVNYYSRLLNPQSSFDRMLVDGSITDSDFFCDIIGTQYLREQNYKEAKRWLGMVSPTFCEGYQLTENRDRLPFEAYKKGKTNDPDYKYNFAREMCHLNEDIMTERNNDRKGMLLLRYAIGMKNSVDYCWSLTECWRNEYDYLDDDTPQTIRMKRTMHKADKLIAKALKMIRSSEVLAQAHYKLNHFKTAAEYAGTPTAQYVRSHCDRLNDYKF